MGCLAILINRPHPFASSTLHPFPHPHSEDTTISLSSMESSHHHHRHHQHHHHPGMFPPVFLPPAPGPTPPSVLPAKREDDDVQFVSSNPVKKRKIEIYQPSMPPPATSYSPPVGLTVPVPVPIPSYQPPEPAKQMTVTTQPERRGSTGMVDPSFTTHLPDADPMRGCSVPIPERIDHSDSFWTAPSTGPQSSPPVSPKSLPEHVSPSTLRLNEAQGMLPQSSLSGSSGLHAAVGFPGPVHPIHDEASVSQPPSTGLEGTPIQPNSGNEMQTETVKDVLPADLPMGLAGVANLGNNPPEHDPASAVDTKKDSAERTAAKLMHNHSWAPAGPDSAVNGPAMMLMQHSRGKVPDVPPRPRPRERVAGDSPLIFSCNSIARHPSARRPSTRRPSAHPSAHGASSQPDNCGSRPATGAKGPCRQCLEARLRQQAANMNAAAGLTPTAKPPGMSQPVPSSAVQQPWAHVLGINPYHNAMAGAMYGPLLQQPFMTGSTGHFNIPQHHPRLAHGLPTQQQGGHMPPLGPSHSMSSAQVFIPAQATTTKAVTAVSSTQPPKLPDTQSNTKHIIVDIADTCLNLFPFEELAKRHNQPEQKVRDIFSAVIQVPLLRCTTDKRRAGKLGTARVKEFNQARKDVQAQVATGQSKEDAATQRPYMPSPWETAQFMGPSDVRLGLFPQFSGPW